MVYLTDLIPEFKRIKGSLDYYNLVIIVGDEGTGKTGFVNNYFNNIDNILINRVDSDTPESVILSFLKSKNIFYKQKVLIYDDLTIKNSLLANASKCIHQTRYNRKFIVIVNKLKPSFKKHKKYIIHETRYPTKQEVFRYINEFRYRRARDSNKPKQDFDDNLTKDILKLDVYNMRRIEYALEDGFLAGEIKIKEERFNITKMDPFIISFYIAENLPGLRRIKENLIDADKLKSVNDYFYLDFIKLHYPNIAKKRLRYPRKLLEILKNK